MSTLAPSLTGTLVGRLVERVFAREWVRPAASGDSGRVVMHLQVVRRHTAR